MRWIVICILFLIMAALAGSVVQAETLRQEAGLQTTTTSRVKLRDGPGTEWAILGYVEAGETVILDGRAPYENIWVRGITADGRIGWIFGENLAAPPEQLAALRVIWVDDPFELAPPLAAAYPEPTPVTPEPTPVPAVAPANVISGVTANARSIFRRGQRLGNRADVFSKVGDSITASHYFLFPVGWGTYDLHGYASLQPVVDYFSRTPARDGSNSFANPSLAAYDGWTTVTVLDPNMAWMQVCQPGETPLACEYHLVRPAVALIMLGTNDLAMTPLDVFQANLGVIVQTSIDLGVIPILSTIPNRVGYESSVPVFNQVIVDTARAYDLPLWDFGAALAGLPASGLGDGVHPSFPPSDQLDNFALAADFSADNLRYGYTVRNLSALQVLDVVWRRALR